MVRESCPGETERDGGQVRRRCGSDLQRIDGKVDTSYSYVAGSYEYRAAIVNPMNRKARFLILGAFNELALGT